MTMLIKKKFIMLLVVGLALMGWAVLSQSSDKDISSKTQIDTANVYDAANGSKLNGASLKASGTPQGSPVAKAPSHLLPVKPEPKPSSMVITNPHYTPPVKSVPKLPAVITTRPGASPVPISKGAEKKGGSLTPPSNDDCTGAPIINTFPQTIYGTTIDATVDCPDELNWNAVWYQLELPYSSNWVMVDYCPTPVQLNDVGMVLFNECPQDCPNYIGCYSNRWMPCSNGIWAPQVFWDALPPGSYWLPVGIWDGSGNPFLDFGITVIVEAIVPPANDDCANAIPVGDVTDLPFSTNLATFDGSGECMTSPNIWYCYTATCTGIAEVSLCGSYYDTKLAVYDGCGCAPVGLMLACNDDACGGPNQSEVYFPVVEGNSYLIEVGGWDVSIGFGVLSTSCYVPPPNDLCTGAPIINTFPTTVYGTTKGATFDCPDAPYAWDKMYAVWYQLDLPYSLNKVIVDYCPSPGQMGDCGRVMYSSCPSTPDCPDWIDPSTLNPEYIQCTDFSWRPKIWWSGLSQGSYWLPVLFRDWAWNPFVDFGITFTVEEVFPPANDNCANAEALAGDVTDLPFSTEGAYFDGPGVFMTSPNIWYCYTATCTGVAHISLCGSNYDTKLAVYDGCSCEPIGAMLASNDQACEGSNYGSEVYIPVVQGNSYLIEVGGYGHCSGTGLLSTSCGPPQPNDECTGAVVINTFPQTVYGTTKYATVDCPSVMGWNAVWYRFDVPYPYNNVSVDFCAWETYGIWEIGVVLYDECDPDCPNYIAAASSQWAECPGGFWNPQIKWTYLPGPASYWFPVYLGMPYDFGFTVSVDSSGPCDMVCPPGAMLEGEPTCYDGYIDNNNGGCNWETSIFQNIGCNTTICGTSGVYWFGSDKYRDTDWFRVKTVDGVLTFSCVAEFPVQIILYDAGLEDCISYMYLDGQQAAKCDTATISTWVPAGVYWLWVGPKDWENYPCGGEYVAKLECTPRVTCGDVTNDDIVDVDDVVYLIDYLYRDGLAPVPYTCVGDVNNNDIVNLGDVVYLINYVYKDGPAPDPNCYNPPGGCK